MSPLLVAWAPYDIKGAELGHSHFIFYRKASMQIWAELNYGRYWHNFFFEKIVRFRALLVAIHSTLVTSTILEPAKSCLSSELLQTAATQ